MHSSCLTAAILLLITGLCGGGAHAETKLVGKNNPKVAAALLAEVSTFKPGQPFRVGLHQKIATHWHTYWKNSGDSGEPTRINWKVPDGFQVSDIDWPSPEAIRVGPLVNYGYSESVLLPVKITPPQEFAGQAVTLTAEASWLVCEEICIPESATLSIRLPVARGENTPGPSADAPLFAAADRNTPVDLNWTASVAAVEDAIELTVKAPELDLDRVRDIAFFPDTWGMIDHAAPQPMTRSPQGFLLRLTPGDLANAGNIPTLKGVLILKEESGGQTVRNSVWLEASPIRGAKDFGHAGDAGEGAEEGRAGGSASSITSPVGPEGIGLLHAIAFAILGGALLNLMPCVLPVISLKIMSLAKSGNSGHGNKTAALSYLFGVLGSFLLLALVLAVMKASGETLGWGFQFQSPSFVLAMAALFFALGLSMSGVFDIGGRIVGFGEQLTRRDGPAGPFFTGVLASVAATPCTAPFMGAAVGFALGRTTVEMVLVLLALGLGFAAPIVALTLFKPVRRLLPKPGAWMETFKQILAFPLYATVVWLVWVLAQQTGADGVLAAGLMLIVVAFAAWMLARADWQSSWRVPVACAIAILGVATAAASVNQPIEAMSPTLSQQATVTDSGVRNVAAFDKDMIEELRRSGQPVFVNFTAAWCITCKVNERVALSGDAFERALRDHGIAYVKADWTNKDAGIAQVLNSHGRAGVPLYLLYPADPAAEPVVLPQILTPSIVVHRFASVRKGSPLSSTPR